MAALVKSQPTTIPITILQRDTETGADFDTRRFRFVDQGSVECPAGKADAAGEG